MKCSGERSERPRAFGSPEDILRLPRWLRFLKAVRFSRTKRTHTQIIYAHMINYSIHICIYIYIYIYALCVVWCSGCNKDICIYLNKRVMYTSREWWCGQQPQAHGHITEKIGFAGTGRLTLAVRFKRVVSCSDRSQMGFVELEGRKLAKRDRVLAPSHANETQNSYNHL